MRAKIHSTDRIVTIAAVGYPGNRTQARAWEGITEQGVRFTAYIPRVQVESSRDTSEFDRELQELHKRPDPETVQAIEQAIEMRMLM